MSISNPQKPSSSPSPRSRAQECIFAAPSASATLTTSDLFLLLRDFAMTSLDYLPDSPLAPRTGHRELSLYFWPNRRHWRSFMGTTAPSPPALQWMTAGAASFTERCQGPTLPDACTASSYGRNLPSGVEDDHAALSEVKKDRRHPASHRRTTALTSSRLRNFWGKVWPRRRNPPRTQSIRRVGLREKEKRSRRDTTPTLSPTVFAGAGNLQRLRSARRCHEGVGLADNQPPAEAENPSWWLFDRGDEVAVQGGRGRYPVSSLCRQTARKSQSRGTPIVMTRSSNSSRRSRNSNRRLLKKRNAKVDKSLDRETQ